MKRKPSFDFEKCVWERGFETIGGVDEVGRGSFAGPAVAGCVAFTKEFSGNIKIPVEINDSKKISPQKRKAAAEWIYENCLTWGIGEVSSALINRIGISKATKVAFRQAVSQANMRLKAKNSGNDPIEYLLIDAFYIPYVPGIRRKNQTPIVKGDEKSFSIAAASIIAKVYRDNFMEEISKIHKFRAYKWGKNKGYGTKEHREAIKKFGITRYHRMKFIDSFLSKI